MKKRLTALLLAGVMTLALAACGGDKPTPTPGSDATPPAAETTVLKLAFNQSENHPQYKALSEMSDKLFEQTEGRYKIEISPNELLGSQKDAFELVQTGAIQMAMVANSIVENVNGDFAVLGLPFLYDSIDHQKEVFTSGVLDDLFATTSTNNFNVMLAFTAGARSVYTNKPIESPADLAGYKIRVMESPTCIAMMDYMGGVGTPMAQGEVYTAIQQSTINGGENNEITYADLKHYEVAPYFSYTTHLMIPDLLVMNSGVLSGMSDADRATVEALCKETTDREFQLWNEQIDSAKQTAIDNGATFVEVDIAPFQANCAPLAEEISARSETCKGLYDAIRALAD